MGDFKSSMVYHDGVATDDFVSLTMRVRRESYIWDDVLHPVFQMNLPEGYLLQVLQEQFGPHIGASPMALLSVIGRNMIGRIQVAPPGASLDEPAKPVDVADLLQGDNSEEVFAELVRQHATSGVSGVVPKFLDTDAEKVDIGRHTKATLFTDAELRAWLAVSRRVADATRLPRDGSEPPSTAAGKQPQFAVAPENTSGRGDPNALGQRQPA